MRHRYWRANSRSCYLVWLCCCSNFYKRVHLHCSCDRSGQSSRRPCHGPLENCSCDCIRYVWYCPYCLGLIVGRRCHSQCRSYFYFQNYDACDQLCSLGWSCWTFAGSSTSCRFVKSGSCRRHSTRSAGHLWTCCFVGRTWSSRCLRSAPPLSAKHFLSSALACCLQVVVTRCTPAVLLPFPITSCYYSVHDSFLWCCWVHCCLSSGLGSGCPWTARSWS